MELLFKKSKFFKWDYSDIKDGYYKSEVQANKIVAVTMINISFVVIVACILYLCKILQINEDFHFLYLTIEALAEFLVPSILCFIFKGRDKHHLFKYFLLIEFSIALFRFYSVISVATAIVACIPVVLSCRYYDKKFTLTIVIVNGVLFILSTIAGATFMRGEINFNAIRLDPNFIIDFIGSIDSTGKGRFDSSLFRASDAFNQAEYLKNLIEYISFPIFLLYVVMAVICVSSSVKGKEMIEEQKENSRRSASIKSELNLATQIQISMMPSIFPPFASYDEFDVFATMTPAKEVGGDFYDFFAVDDTHIGICIADVSGKGIPAALFMMISKTIIKNYAISGMKVNEVFKNANAQLLDGNKTGLFVTAWLGILDIKNEKLSYAVAGHNPPLIRRKGGQFEYLKSRPNLFLAGIEGTNYVENVIDFHPGDKIYLYTDGVTEATDIDNNLYGEQRLQDFINNHGDASVEDILPGIKGDIDIFVKGREQYDDITMLMLDFKNKYCKPIELNIKSDVNELSNIVKIINDELSRVNAPDSVMNKMELAVEEIYVNICNYAYKGKLGKVNIIIKVLDDEIRIVFVDAGVKFNPLDKEDPDISLDAMDREIGGLGIFVVKNVVDECKYEYKDKKNVLSLVKRW